MAARFVRITVFAFKKSAQKSAQKQIFCAKKGREGGVFLAYGKRV